MIHTIATALVSLLMPFTGSSFGSGISQLNPWTISGSAVRLASTTANLRIPSLTGCDTIDTDGNGVFSCGTDTGGGSGFSTTSADYWKTQRNFFSTTSADYWETTQTARTADDLSNNSIEDLSDVAAMTKNYGDLLFWNGSTWTDIATGSLGIVGAADGTFSTTSASYFASLGLAFSTTSADHWETLQTARTADDLTNNSIEDLSDVAAIAETYGDLLGWNGTSWTDFATSSLRISWTDLTNVPTQFGQAWELYGAGTYLAPTTTKGVIVQASSTITLLSAQRATTSNLSATNVTNITGTTGMFYADLVQSLTWTGRALYDTTGAFEVINWGTQLINDASGVLAIDWDDRTFNDSTGNIVATWPGGFLARDNAGNNVFDAFSRTLLGNLGNADIAIDYTTSNTVKFNQYNCSGSANSGKLTVNASGEVVCGDDVSGGGGAAFGQAWELFSAGTYLAPTTSKPIIVNNATSTITNLTTVNATSTNATTTNLYVSAAATLAQLTSAAVITNAAGLLAEYAGASCTNQFVRSLNALIAATCASVDLVNDITGILAVANGGTGWAAIQAGAIPYGNGTSRVATTTQGTGGQVLAWLNGVPSWAATTTPGTGLSYSGGAFTVNTSQNIATLSNLTTNGLVTTSGGAGTLSVTANGTNGQMLAMLGGIPAWVASTTFSGGLTYLAGNVTADLGTSITAAEIANGDHGDFTYSGGSATIDADAIALGTDTTGNYLATLADSGAGTLTVSGSGSETAAVTATINLTNANTWTGIQRFYGMASSTVFSAHSAFFGATATSSFSTAGVLTLASALTVANGGTGAATLTGLLQGNGTSAITGITGTAGQFPYYNGASTLLATSTVFLTTGGRVGIASTTPMSLFGVQGTTTTQTLNVDNSTKTGTSTIYIYSKTASFGGEVILEDSDGAGCTAVGALNGVLFARTVTCPADPTSG